MEKEILKLKLALKTSYMNKSINKKRGRKYE